jgi:signal transduction histidine kinase
MLQEDTRKPLLPIHAELACHQAENDATLPSVIIETPSIPADASGSPSLVGALLEDSYQMHPFFLTFCEKHEEVFSETLSRESYLSMQYASAFLIVLVLLPVALIVVHSDIATVLHELWANLLIAFLTACSCIYAQLRGHWKSEYQKVFLCSATLVVAVSSFNGTVNWNFVKSQAYMKMQLDAQIVKSPLFEQIKPFMFEDIALTTFSWYQFMWLIIQVVVMVTAQPKFQFAMAIVAVTTSGYVGVVVLWRKQRALHGIPHPNEQGEWWEVLINSIPFLLVTILILAHNRGNEIMKRKAWIETVKRRAVESELRQHQRRQLHQAEILAQAQTDLLAWVCHEVRNPFNGIKGYAEILVQQLGPGDDLSGSASSQILSCSEHICSLLDNMLDLAKLQAGRLDLKNEHFALEHLFDDVCSIARPLAAEGVELRTTVEALDLGPDTQTEKGHFSVRGDFLRWKQCLLNVVTNALQATLSGAVTIHGGPGNIPGSIMISVTDTGPGLQPQEIQAVFRKYISLRKDGNASRPTARTRKTEYTKKRRGGEWAAGTGLGLPIAQCIAQRQGGEIRIESPWAREFLYEKASAMTAAGEMSDGFDSHTDDNLVQGARFYWEIPSCVVYVSSNCHRNSASPTVQPAQTRAKQAKAAPAAAPAAPAAEAQECKNVLLVEDCPMNSMIMVHKLNECQLGVRLVVEVASTDVACLSAVEAGINAVDLIIMDEHLGQDQQKGNAKVCGPVKTLMTLLTLLLPFRLGVNAHP